MRTSLDTPGHAGAADDSAGVEMSINKSMDQLTRSLTSAFVEGYKLNSMMSPPEC